MFDNIIDEYLDRVTMYMDAGKSSEIRKELRSHILDSAEAIAAERKTEVNEGIIKEVIAKMGPAEKIAGLYPGKEMFLKKGGMFKALGALAGIAIAFLVVGIAFWALTPDIQGLPKGEIVSVILSIVGALTIAIVVIGIIFALMYAYDTQVKRTYGDRLKSFEKSLNEAVSPLRIGILTVMNLIFVVLLVLFWDRIPMLTFHGSEMIPLFSAKFGAFVPFFVFMALATVVVSLLYFVIPMKWIPSLGETILAAANVILLYIMLQVFPFNDALPGIVITGLYIVLILAILGCVIDTAKKLWQTVRFAMNFN